MQPSVTLPEEAAAQPVVPRERLASLDFIRGVAVLGILAANIVAFGQPPSAYWWPGAFLTAHGDTSNWLWLGQFVLVDGKMRGLFSLLFGAGLALFADKALDHEEGLFGLQLRRLGWLLVFGLAHFYLVWRGDILVLYALIGMVALIFLRWQQLNLIVLSALLYLAGTLAYVGTMATPFFIADTAFGASEQMAVARAGIEEARLELLAKDQLEIAIMTGGTYADFVAANVTEHLTSPLTTMMIYLFDTLPLMLMGMVLYRAGLFSGGIDERRQRLWGWAGVIGGSLVTLALGLWIMDKGLTFWGTFAGFMALSHLPRLPVILGLAALLALVARRRDGWLARRVKAAGRMAFSNYLGTSLVMMLVFHPWAGGLWGKLTRPELYGVMLAGWVLMLGWSQPWLARFRFGPLEWLWRCLTYWRLFPLRRAER